MERGGALFCVYPSTLEAVLSSALLFTRIDLQRAMLLARHHLLLLPSLRISSPFPQWRASDVGFPRFTCSNVFYCATSCTAELHKPVSSSVLVAREFDELNLKQTSGQVGRVRIRQHVNPLKASLMAPVIIPKWDGVFADPSLPVMVDIGCGSGRFLMVLAKQNSGSCNYLGLEIREKLVSRSKLWAKELNLRNIYFMVANGTFAFDSILSSYPGKLTCVSILCPDPHFKKRHHKRRLVQKPLVDAVIKHLSSGGKLFLQSDVLEVAVDMRRQFEPLIGISLVCEDLSNPLKFDNDGWLLENPFGIPTEREIHAHSEGGHIYRLLYTQL